MANGSIPSMNILITLYILSSIISVFVEGFLATSPTTHDVHKTNTHHIHQLLLLKNNNVGIHVHKATRLILKSNNNDGSDGNISSIARTVLIYSLSVAALLASIGTIYSEVSVIQTGCGPKLLPDIVERSCYLGVIVISGLSVFLRIVTGSGVADAIINKTQDDKNDTSLQLFRLVEYLSLLAVLGAFISLGSQTIRGEQMDGLSGINVEMCKTIQQLNY